jgi:hypothetical protein
MTLPSLTAMTSHSAHIAQKDASSALPDTQLSLRRNASLQLAATIRSTTKQSGKRLQERNGAPTSLIDHR